MTDFEDLVEYCSDSNMPIELNVDDREADFAAVQQAFDRFGTIDVVVNNAGYGQFGTVEELSKQEVRQQRETKLFGTFWVTQAVLPYLRKQGHGHILQVSSIGGVDAYDEIRQAHTGGNLPGGPRELIWSVRAFRSYGCRVVLSAIPNFVLIRSSFRLHGA